MAANEIVLEHVHVIFRNFSGSPDAYHRQGAPRSFHVVLDADKAEEIKSMGYNVKMRESKRDPGETFYTLQVFLRFDMFPPKIYQISNGKMVSLGEEHASLLDREEFENVDIVIRPYAWSADGRHGVKAYLKCMYVTIREDSLAEKYAQYQQ